jgi:hypothetical protein
MTSSEGSASFNVYLSSDVNCKFYNEQNEIGCFTTKLSKRIELEGAWEVGVREVFIPNYLQNIRAPHNSIQLSKVLDIVSSDDFSKREIDTVVFQPGWYTPSSFCDVFNEKVQQLREIGGKKNFNVQLKFDTQTKAITVTLGRGEKMTVRSLKLRRMLGSRKYTSADAMGSEIQTVTFMRTAHFHLKLNHLYLYSDISRATWVGNTSVPLLRVVSVEPGLSERETFHSIYEKPQYHELKGNSIGEIRVELRDSMGQNVTFSNGEVLVVLHFRPAVTARNRIYL